MFRSILHPPQHLSHVCPPVPRFWFLSLPPPHRHPSHFTCLPVLLVLDKWGFCLPWHPSVFIFWREGQKEDEGLEVCGEKFLEDVPGLCSQGTSCSQCERGTLSMRSISMTIIFILQQSGSRQHSAGGGRGAFPPIRYTPCNILAVHTNKSREREDSENIVNLRQTLQNSRFLRVSRRVVKCTRAEPQAAHVSRSDTVAAVAQCCGKRNIWWLCEIRRVGQVRCCRCSVALLWRALAPCRPLPSASFQNATCVRARWKMLSRLTGKSTIFQTGFYKLCAQEFWLGGGGGRGERGGTVVKKEHLYSLPRRWQGSSSLGIHCHIQCHHLTWCLAG